MNAHWIPQLSVLVNTHPYLDPGSGSFIIQMVIAALLGGAVLIKVYWRKLISLFTGRSPEQKPNDPDIDDDITL